jgi:hypothetical protein
VRSGSAVEDGAMGAELFVETPMGSFIEKKNVIVANKIGDLRNARSGASGDVFSHMTDRQLSLAVKTIVASFYHSQYSL